MAIGNPINLTSNVEGKSISVSATAGQTQFTVTGGYRINQISVYRNGVRLVDGRDFTATDGSIVTLLSAASVDDVVEFQVFDDFRVSDALNVNSGGTVNGDVTVNGALTVSTTTITGTATTAQGLTGTPDIAVTNITAGIITATGNISAVDGTFTGNVTVGGTLTYEDVTNIDAVGVITARSDVSIADKIIHTGDTNTAIRFPAADTFTVETSGSERVRVDSSGRFLVGVNASQSVGFVHRLQVEGTDAGSSSISLLRNSNDSSSAQLNLAKTRGTSTGSNTVVQDDDSLGEIKFRGADGTDKATEGARITASVDGTPGSNDMPGRLTFHTTADGASSPTERIRITSAGLVGIGTASPGSELHLQAGDSNCAFKIVNTSGGSGGLIQVNGSDFNFNNLDSGIMRFYTADTERVRITSDGKMGVGENSPQQRLHVSSTSSTYIQVQNTGDSVNAYYGVDTASAWAGSSTNHPFKLHTNNTERLRIDTSGRLLCGHTSSIDTGGVESQVQVVGTDTEKSSLCLARFVNDSGEPFLIFAKSRNGTKGGNTVVQDDDTIGRISFQGADGTDYEEAASIKGEVDGSPAGEATDMPGRLLFGTTADGDHNATERLRIDSVGTFHFKNGLMIENGSTGTTARNGTQNVDLDAGMVRYYSTASTGTWKPNFRVSSSVSINSLMGTSDVISPTMIVAKGATTHFANAIQIDGSDVTPEFFGGAPTDGGGSGTFDVYNYTIIKTGDAAYKVFASVSTYE